MEDQAKAVVRMVQDDAEHEARVDAEARATAHALIQGYLGPDHKVTNMQNFYSALVQALKAAREQGHADHPRSNSLLL
jgi:hypothetical protein